jgi:hypothetical protein
MPETSTLSVAEPLTVYGSGDPLFKTALSAGSVIEDEGAVKSGAASVVYENRTGAAIGLPTVSVTAVVIVTLYPVEYAWPLVVNTAWLFKQLASDHPGLLDIMFVVFTVPQLTFSFQLIVTLLFNVTSVALSAGIVVFTVGAVLSMVTVLPAEGVSTVLDESVALL